MHVSSAPQLRKGAGAVCRCHAHDAHGERRSSGDRAQWQPLTLSFGGRLRDAADAAAEAREAGPAPPGEPAEPLVPFAVLAEAAADEGGVPDLSAALARIRQVARVLGNFAALRDPSRARADYVDQVRKG